MSGERIEWKRDPDGGYSGKAPAGRYGRGVHVWSVTRTRWYAATIEAQPAQAGPFPTAGTAKQAAVELVQGPPAP